MSTSGEILFSVTLRHLSPDAKKAGAELAEAQLHYLSAKQLRSLLESAAALAPGVAYPVEPELRISAETGKFVVQLKGGGLHFVSWSSSIKADGQLTPAQMVAAMTGEEVGGHASAGRRQSAAAAGSRGIGQSLTIGLLFAAIVMVNVFTVWFITRPPRSLLPKYTLLQPEPAERLLADVAGVYETGGAPGDRRLEIQKDGSAQRIKFGPERTATQKLEFTVKAAEAAGKPALVTSRKSIITIRDPLSVVLHGDKYQRVTR